MDLDLDAMEQLAASQHVELRSVLSAVTTAMRLAYQKSPGADPHASVSVDEETGRLLILNEAGHDVTPAEFGRTAAAISRQAMVQWLRDVERQRLAGPWAGREGEVLHGVVRGPGRNGELRMSVERVEAVLPAGEMIAGEDLPEGQSVAVYVLAVNVTDQGKVRLTVSRRQPGLVTGLLAGVAPVLISQLALAGAARDPGSHTKVGVWAPGDWSPQQVVEAVAGVNGAHTQQVTRILGGERVEVIPASEDLPTYVVRALGVEGLSAREGEQRGQVVVEGPAETIEEACGEGDANLRLAQRLTGAKIEVGIS